VKQHRLKRKALAISIACALALTWTTDYISVYAEAGSEQSQETKETVNADGKAAQEYSLESLTVEAKRPDWESKLSPGTVTIIRPDDYKGEQKTLPDLLKDVPGVHVREVNGKGQYTTVSVRGSTAAQVGVFVDGVLFNLGGDAAADISTIPVKNVERIEVYRGYIPARFGGTYIGGVINIVTKRPTQSNVSASVGQSSWGGYTGSLQVDSPLGKGSLMAGINRDESDGDFRYKNFQVPSRYNDIMQEYEKLPVTKLQYYNLQVSSLNINLGIPFTWDSFTSLEEVQQATTPGSAFYNGLKSAGIAAGYSAEDMEFVLSSPEWFGYDPEFQKKWWDEKMTGNPGVTDEDRYRRNNDYKNTDAIIKWQDDHWVAKATWKKIDRHLPEGLWAGNGGYGNSNTYVDLDDSSSLGPRRQELTAKELLVGRRDTVGKMEWGWSVNYLDQNKDYRNERYDPVKHENDYYFKHPLRIWSSYDSRRVGGAIDGSYEAGNGHLLEFMANLSKEKMDIDGSGITNFVDGEIDWRRRFRNYFEQTLFNIQLQDTITLNKAEDLWFTPSVRYNSSTVLGRSTRLITEHNNHIWFNQEDEQQDSKVTWQAALKKKVSDKLTLRSTVGSYYRLLNLYEIAGDGAGIMPRPIYDKDFKAGLISAFPLPEEGTQWDVSAIWDDRILGADGNIQLTYFGRKSENLLQLYRFGYDYWSYSNAARGRVNGAELQTKLSWDKWDMNLATTYTHLNAQRKYNNPTGTGETYYDMPATYLPEWEGSMRLTYRPDQKTSVFTELKYMDKMFVSESFEWKQKPLTTVGLGIKHKFTNDLQVAVGVNDLFNKGPELRLVKTGLDNDGNPLPPDWPSAITYPLNTDHPTQGRTYYVTMQYKY
jgi:vitamin B12 transporter